MILTKICSWCNIPDAVDGFTKNVQNKDGFSSWCKTCVNDYSRKFYKQNKDVVIQKQRRYKKNNPEKYKQTQRRRIYKQFNITYEQYQQMFNAQNGVCLICKQSSYKALSIDHDHVTGRVRALLCGGCNFAVGQIKESVQTAKALLKYVEEFCNV